LLGYVVAGLAQLAHPAELVLGDSAQGLDVPLDAIEVLQQADPRRWAVFPFLRRREGAAVSVLWLCPQFDLAESDLAHLGQDVQDSSPWISGHALRSGHAASPPRAPQG